MKLKPTKSAHLRRDILVIVLSISLSFFLVKFDVLKTVLSSTGEIKALSSFFAGMLFTSVFTTPLAIVTLGELSLSSHVLFVAFWGSCGALLGDIVIFLFVKDSVSKDVEYMMSKVKTHKRLYYFLKLKIFRWLTPLVGALVIASPLPDELGIAMMGESKIRLPYMMVISFVMNFVGILLIGFVAQQAL